ncbi:uncharacterized protein LOC123300659 isoform X1 [Chrysoperla carnea]|uniref:uncharacterized protein LOC123300659 isoform X1 n=1 Tax=Chrysoperla carnea TaxID=189513 RepID=UPI001D0801EA|nr:uncharacterized protein LOC123300659 isoform X1 [Chrysoperla carnea]
MLKRNYETDIAMSKPPYETVLLIMITFTIGIWLLYLSTKQYQKESIRIMKEVMLMRKRIGDICNEIASITKHCDEQYNQMDGRLRDVQYEIEKHLIDIDQIERYIVEKTNLRHVMPSAGDSVRVGSAGHYRSKIAEIIGKA